MRILLLGAPLLPRRWFATNKKRIRDWRKLPLSILERGRVGGRFGLAADANLWCCLEKCAKYIWGICSRLERGRGIAKPKRGLMKMATHEDG